MGGDNGTSYSLYRQREANVFDVLILFAKIRSVV